MPDDNVLINQSDLTAIGDSMYDLSKSVDMVTSHMDAIGNKMSDMESHIQQDRESITMLEQEVRQFMSDIQKTTMVNNAKQSVMLLQMEYDKRFGHRDQVRRRVVGLLQSMDINSVKMNTMESIGEETIVNNPDYWLAPALVALCYWYANNKEMAQKALKRALDRSNEKTSLLFCLVHMRANRVNTAIKWLERYLSLQDPSNMDGKIVLLLDAMASGVFPVEVKDIILRKVNQWKEKLNMYTDYKKIQVDRWENYFREGNTIEVNTDNYINDNVIEKNFVNNVIRYSNYHLQMMDKFKKLMNEEDNNGNNQINKIDKLINMLVFSYDDEENKLKSEIHRQNDIINKYEKDSGSVLTNEYMYYEKKDFYTHIFNICSNDSLIDIDLNTKKMAIALSKEYIKDAYNKISDTSFSFDLLNLNLVIESWCGITKDGKNELELINGLSSHIESKYHNDIHNKPLWSKLMIVLVVLSLLILIIFFKYFYIGLAALVASCIYSGVNIYKNYKFKQTKIKQMEQEKKLKVSLLKNTVCEIVDYYYIYMDSVKGHDEFISYIDSLNYDSYIKTSLINNKRNIIIGGK